MPVAPQRVLGDDMDPSVSVPIANPTQPAATALALPAEDPDEPCFLFQGLRVRPPSLAGHHRPAAEPAAFALRISPKVTLRQRSHTELRNQHGPGSF